METLIKFMLYPIAMYQLLLEFAFRLPVVGSFIMRIFDLVTSMTVSLLRLLSGSKVAGGKLRKNDLPLVLYEFEGCPFCRRVRETLTVLDLDVIIHPCPKETLKSSEVRNSRYRGEVLAKGGKVMFPYLVDVNTQTEMYDSDRIINYLWNTYGKDAIPPLSYRLVNSPWYKTIGMAINFIIPALLRPLPRMGMIRTPSRKPEKPLELWGYEESPVTRLVRETLSSLEITYIHHPVAKGSPNRKIFYERFGTLLSGWRRTFGLVKVPLLFDPNTDKLLFESADIVKYLNEKYKIQEPPNETILDFNFNKMHAEKKQSQHQH